MLLTFINEFGAQVAVNILMGLVSDDALAAQNLMAQFYFFTYIALICFGQATSQEFSRKLGEGKYKDAKTTARGGFLSVFLVLSPFIITVMSYPKSMAYLLNNQGYKGKSSDHWFNLVPIMMVITAIGVLFDGLGFNALQVLRAADDNLIPSLYSISSLWLGVAMAAILGFSYENSNSWRAYNVSMGYYSIGLGARFFLLFKRWLTEIKTDNLEIMVKKNTLSKNKLEEKNNEIEDKDKIENNNSHKTPLLFNDSKGIAFYTPEKKIVSKQMEKILKEDKTNENLEESKPSWIQNICLVM